jgi:hypothetical protein
MSAAALKTLTAGEVFSMIKSGSAVVVGRPGLAFDLVPSERAGPEKLPVLPACLAPNQAAVYGLVLRHLLSSSGRANP